MLILAPVGRDASLLAGTLAALQIETAIASDGTDLLQRLAEGAGAAIVAEEALPPHALPAFEAWLKAQPPWSDMPFLVLTSSGRPTRQSERRAEELRALGNLVFIERPARPQTIHSTVNTALRGRMRQYELRSRQEALLQANADLEQFAHSASHDLREPLRSIGIYSELLGREYSSRLDARGNEFLSFIHSAAKRMDALLRDLRAYSYASSIADDEVGEAEAHLPLQAALENLSGTIRESGARISIGELPAVKMRESHLSLIFQNLVENAIKYRKEGVEPRIELSAKGKDGLWVFTVADNGIGVPATYREAIFGIFKRLHGNGTYSGTGMGLAICKRIVERYGGRIWVESDADEGSQFSFSVPR